MTAFYLNCFHMHNSEQSLYMFIHLLNIVFFFFFSSSVRLDLNWVLLTSIGGIWLAMLVKPTMSEKKIVTWLNTSGDTRRFIFIWSATDLGNIYKKHIAYYLSEEWWVATQFPELQFYPNDPISLIPSSISNIIMESQSQSWTWVWILSTPTIQSWPEFFLSYPKNFNFIHLSLPKINFILLSRNCVGNPREGAW